MTEPTADDQGAEPRRAGLWGKRGFRPSAYLAMAVLSVGVGWGVASAIGGHSSDIPMPPAKNDVFVEDDNGAGQDTQTNILALTAPGMVQIMSDGRAVEAGVVITKSGYVLSSDRGLTGALSARFAMSGKTYPIHVVGSDDVAGLALLRLSGAASYPVAHVGNSNDVHLQDRVSSAGPAVKTKGFTLSNGMIIGLNVPTTIGGHRVTGLIEVNSFDMPAQETGGPLLNLSGQVLGISVTPGPHGIAGSGYVVPIDAALSIARQIAG